MSEPGSGSGQVPARRKLLGPLRAVVVGTALLVPASFAAVLVQASSVGAFEPALPDIPATDHLGRPAKLSDYRGRWVVAFFGYSHCPDVCPTGLTNLVEVLRELGPAAKEIQPMLVSLDPARDTPDVLASYVTYFYPGMVGLRLAEADLARFARQLGVLYSRPDPEDGSIDHTAYFYAINPRGVLTRGALFPPLKAEALRRRMDESRWKGIANFLSPGR